MNKNKLELSTTSLLLFALDTEVISFILLDHMYMQFAKTNCPDFHHILYLHGLYFNLEF